MDFFHTSIASYNSLCAILFVQYLCANINYDKVQDLGYIIDSQIWATELIHSQTANLFVRTVSLWHQKKWVLIVILIHASIENYNRL